MNSGLGVCIACTTSSTRTLFGMARTGALPAARPGAAAARHPGRRGLPAVRRGRRASAWPLGLPLGPYNLFNLLGTTGTFVYIPIFVLMNVAACRYFRAVRRKSSTSVPFVVCPVISTVALITIGYKSIVPLPASPV